MVIFLDQASQASSCWTFYLWFVVICVYQLVMVHFFFCFISGDLLRIEAKTLHSILEEVIFKLLSTVSPVMRNTATKLLLLMAQSHQEILILLSACYKGSTFILSFFEIWKNNIFIEKGNNWNVQIKPYYNR